MWTEQFNRQVIPMSETIIKQIEEMQKAQALEEAQPVKRGRGRPKGSRNSKESTMLGHNKVDPVTGIVVDTSGRTGQIIGKIGDERVSSFVQYHVEMMKMRQGVDKKNVPDLYQRFINYLSYCAEHCILPNNMNAYFAIGIDRGDIYQWSSGQSGTPEHKKFAQDVKAFFASIHEQAPTDGLMNPISAMFWQKAHDGMIEAQKLEVVNADPLGEKRSAAEIAKQYADLPDD